jgi:beta-lactamase regulating signal transducer with metallopeptidase domain
VSALLDFWHEILIHLWQSTLVLFILFLLSRLFPKTPAKVSHALWNIGLIKLFLPLSLFGNLTSALSRRIIGTPISERYGAIADLPAVAVVVNPLKGQSLDNPAAGPVMTWIVAGITAICCICLLRHIFRIANDLIRSRRYRGSSVLILDSPAREKLGKTLDASGIPVERVLCTKSSIMPLVAGLFVPKILISEYLVMELSEKELEAVLLH